MPFKSSKQRRFMFSRHPEIAKRWATEGKAYVDRADHPNRKVHNGMNEHPGIPRFGADSND